MITQSIKNIWWIHQWPYPLNHTRIHHSACNIRWVTRLWTTVGKWSTQRESPVKTGRASKLHAERASTQIMCNCGLTRVEVFPSSYANSRECTCTNIYQLLLDSSAHYIWLPALRFKTLQICFLLTEGRWWWEGWTDSLTLALWLWLCSGEPREWPEAAPTECSPDVKDSPRSCLNLYFNQISMYITPFYWLFC